MKLTAVKRGGSFHPTDQSGIESIKSISDGCVVMLDIRASRNIRFHRKFFAMLNLGFEYWEPESLITDAEISAANRMIRIMRDCGLSSDACENITAIFMDDINSKRSSMVIEKSFEAYREWVTIEAGFSDTIATPSGPRKRAKSISFSSMDDVAFSQLYKSVFNVVWEISLKKIFASEADAELAVSKLLSMA